MRAVALPMTTERLSRMIVSLSSFAMLFGFSGVGLSAPCNTYFELISKVCLLRAHQGFVCVVFDFFRPRNYIVSGESDLSGSAAKPCRVVVVLLPCSAFLTFCQFLSIEDIFLCFHVDAWLGRFK